jgi:hypothetical protein
MKSSYLLLTLILASFVIKAQIVQDSIPKHYELNRPQYNAWNYIYQEWMTKEYGKILMENNLKMNCSSCLSVYMNVIIRIDSLGKLKEYKVITAKKCGTTFTKKLEESFMQWFLIFKFPLELYNNKFEVKLGTGLKC